VVTNYFRGLVIAVMLNGRERKLLVDSGSEISILKAPMEGVVMNESGVAATGVTGNAVSVEGQQELECNLDS